jgi:hypothetical protein
LNIDAGSSMGCFSSIAFMNRPESLLTETGTETWYASADTGFGILLSSVVGGGR